MEVVGDRRMATSNGPRPDRGGDHYPPVRVEEGAKPVSVRCKRCGTVNALWDHIPQDDKTPAPKCLHCGVTLQGAPWVFFND